MHELYLPRNFNLNGQGSDHELYFTKGAEYSANNVDHQIYLPNESIPPLVQVIPFVPTDIENCILWLDAEYEDQYYNNNDDVGTWHDRSDTGDDATQTTAVNKPHFLTNQINGKPAIDFDGSNHFMKGSGAILTDDGWSFFAVIKADGASTGGKVFAQHTGSGDFGRCAAQLDSSDGDNWQWFFNNGSSYSVTSTATVDTGTHIVYIEGDDSGGWELRIDGGNVDGNLSGQALTPLNTTYSIGATTAPNGFYNGLIAEIIIYDDALGTDDRESVEDYLKSKWGIS